jgi:hypothetical protein
MLYAEVVEFSSANTARQHYVSKCDTSHLTISQLKKPKEKTAAIHFGPGVQLTKETGGKTVIAGITEQVAEMILEERRNCIVDSAFVPCEQPILPDPTHAPTAKEKTGPRKKNLEATRRSSRQQAQACSVPVSMRATHRLVRAFEIVGPEEKVGEEALDEYISSFQTPMTDKAIKAVRMLTSLDSGPVLAASAQLLAAEGGDGATEVEE